MHLTSPRNFRDDTTMDPKQNMNQPLDPKLKAAYDRVMGVNLTGAPTTDSGATAPATVSPTGVPVAVVPPAISPTPPAMPDISATISPLPTPTNPMSSSMQSAGMPQAATDISINSPSPSVTPQNPTINISMPASPSLGGPATVPPTPVTPAADVATRTPVATLADPAKPVMDSMSATINIPVHHDSNETVKIGIGGGPVGSAVAKPHGKGISPVILVFGALAFLVVYALFWVKFFGYTLPFLPK